MEMTIEELRKGLLDGEDVSLEAKSAKGGFPDSFWESYSAFANTDGGTIVLGVKETKNHELVVEGLADVRKMKQDLWNLLNNRQKISANILTERMVHDEVLDDGAVVLVVEVPRAERSARPVYKGMDPFLGTYRRYGEGDHLCTRESVAAMMRDASQFSMDVTAIVSMDMSVFCDETVRAYRNLFESRNPNHLWSKLDKEVFLRRIKAVDLAEDGQYHPTEAGLLMFGYEYEIVRRFPQYFLDYQEDRLLTGVTRWKDRVTSSSGDWSGNLFDFTFKVLGRLQSDLKVPFVMRGNLRVDDTPIHKLLREALTNTLAHADYNGRQGVVISKNSDGFVFANPGRMRIPVDEAVSGGVSDPRNSTLLKMFSLIRFGERAGSGLNGIMHVWRHVYHTEASIGEKDGEVDRTILTLPFGGREQDVEAMMQFYDDPTELSPNDFVSQKEWEKRMKELDPSTEKTTEKDVTSTEKTTEKIEIATEKHVISTEKSEITTEKTTEKILRLIMSNPAITAKELASELGITIDGVDYNIRKLKKQGLIQRIGGDKGGSWKVLV